VANLLLRGCFQLLLVLLCLLASARKDLWQFLQGLLFPLGDLGGMYPIFAGDFIGRLVPLDRLQCDLRFELGAGSLALPRYGFLLGCTLLDTAILSYRPVQLLGTIIV